MKKQHYINYADQRRQLNTLPKELRAVINPSLKDLLSILEEKNKEKAISNSTEQISEIIKNSENFKKILSDPGGYYSTIDGRYGITSASFAAKLFETLLKTGDEEFAASFITKFDFSAREWKMLIAYN